MFPIGWGGQAAGSPAILTLQPRIFTEYSNAGPVPNCDVHDIYRMTSLAVASLIGAPWGTPYEGQWLEFEITDNGTARALTWASIYMASGTVTLPTTTFTSTLLSIAFQYSSTLGKWVCKGVA